MPDEQATQTIVADPVASAEAEAQERIVENIFGAAEDQPPIDEQEVDRGTPPASHEKSEPEKAPAQPSAPAQQPQASPAPMPGADPWTGQPMPGAFPGFPPTPGQMPQPPQVPGMPGFPQPGQPFGQPFGQPATPQTMPWQQMPGAFPNAQPPQPQGYKPYELPQLSPDEVDRSIVDWGQKVNGGFDHVNQHVAQLQNQLMQLQMERAQEQYQAQYRQELENASWFDGQVSSLADTHESWAKQLGKGAFPQQDVTFQSERQQLKNIWDGWRRMGLDNRTAFEYAKNSRYAHIVGQLQAQQAAQAANELADGAGVPPRGEPGKGTGQPDAYSAELARLKAQGKIP